jgi:hypothetical protein
VYLAVLTLEIATTITSLITACYITQSAVYQCHRPNIGDALTKHRTSLLRLLDDRTRSPGDTRIDISWFFNEAVRIADDISYAVDRLVVNVAPLLADAVRRAEGISSGLKILRSQQIKVLAQWKSVSEVIRAYLSEKDSQPGSYLFSDLRISLLTSITLQSGLDALEETAALQTKLTGELEGLSNFWVAALGQVSLHFSNRRIQMAAGEIKEYTDGWVQVKMASRQAANTIKLAYSSYVVPVVD